MKFTHEPASFPSWVISGMKKKTSDGKPEDASTASVCAGENDMCGYFTYCRSG